MHIGARGMNPRLSQEGSATMINRSTNQPPVSFAAGRQPSAGPGPAQPQEPRRTDDPKPEHDFKPRLTPARRKALHKARAMLARNKLGGADETFNHADVKPAVTALMNDKKGLKREIPAKLRAEGKTWEANIAKGALEGKFGISYSVARGRIKSEAPVQIRAEMAAKLTSNGIKAPTRPTVDAVPRKLTFDDLRAFEEASSTLQDMQREATKETGVALTFPKGISKAAI